MSRIRVLLTAVALTACGGLRTVPLVEAPASLVIRDVTVVDVVSGQLEPHRTVVVMGAQISEVLSATAVVSRGAQVIEGHGLFLMPGLWDMHSHSLWSPEAMQTFLPTYVAQGVTGIRDMGGQMSLLAAFRASFRASGDKGEPEWPRVVAAGEVLDGPEPVQADISIAVSDAASATAAVDSLARAGADFVKVYTLLPRDAYFAALSRAKQLKLAVAGHVPADVTPEEAALAGQRSIEHLRDEIEPFCSKGGVSECAHLAEVFRKTGTWQVPTLTVLHTKAFFDDPAMASDPRLRYIPVGVRAEWQAAREGKLGRGSDYVKSKRERYGEEAWLIGFLARERVPLLAGSDAGNPFCFPGFSLHDELALMVEAGLTPLEALRTATLAPADYLDARASMGSVAAGRVADLVLLKGNPLENIRATREIEAVVLRGRYLNRQALDRLLETVATMAEP